MNNKLDPLEAILIKEPHGNSYEIIEPYNTLKYPFCFIGQIKCKFLYKNKIYEGEGIGTLIGPQIVLTSSHNLIFTIDNKQIKATDIQFIPCANGKFKIFEEIKCSHYLIPEKYNLACKKGNFDEMVENDFCLLLLDRNFGDELIKYLDIEDNNNLKLDLVVKDNFYSFFENNHNITDMTYQNGNSSNNKFNLQHSKISMISYTKYNECSLKMPGFIYRKSITKLNNTLNLYKELEEYQPLDIGKLEIII